MPEYIQVELPKQLDNYQLPDPSLATYWSAGLFRSLSTSAKKTGAKFANLPKTIVAAFRRGPMSYK